MFMLCYVIEKILFNALMRAAVPCTRSGMIRPPGSGVYFGAFGATAPPGF